MDEKIRSLLAIVEANDSLAHLIPILAESQKAAAKGPGFSEGDIARVADLIMKLPGVSSIDDAIARAQDYENAAKPNMFARSLMLELERRKSNT